MIDIDDVREDLKSISEKLSELTKTISLSTLAMSWLLLIGGRESPVLPHPPNRYLLIFTGCISLLSLVIGYLQYVFAYGSSKATHDLAEARAQTATEYDSASLLYKLRAWMFWAKQGVAGVAVMLLFSALFLSIA
jgi:hypothetical protein